ncbi:uncharacterized protein LOC125235222 [Leguminivora glycinivorella]|uniref:uncharacterized protein LOC125235222 n=1 Tax=Leguminivora glycinivorella TaxID=1035111 RepID=UPI00200BBE9C|nr:uncharacterized protein LOC125235222 [Leguminivora glycinivorella]
MDTLNEYTLELPDLIPFDPALWFALVEPMFAAVGVVDDTKKYFWVVSKLKSSEAKELGDVLMDPLENGQYDKLKTAMIDRLYSEKEAKKFVGDKPSVFFLHLKILGRFLVPEEVILKLWMERLPLHVKTILELVARQPKKELDKVAITKIADVIAENFAPKSVVTMTTDQVKILLQEVADLKQQMVEIKALVMKLVAQRDGPQSRSRGRSRRRSTSRSSSAGITRVCWYHRVYGGDAHNCVSPCSY